MITEQEILRYIGKQPKNIASFKQIAHDLAVKGKERRPLQQLLNHMTRGRKLAAVGKDRWSFPTSTPKQDVVVGRLRMHRDGFGFVIPDPESLPARAQGKLLGDIFIPPPEVGNAMHGDQVLVEMGRIKHDGKAEGRIVRVMEREQETVVGTFHRGGGHNYVTPIDEKVAMEIIIPQGMEHPKQEDLEHEDDAGQPSDEERHVPAPARKREQGQGPHRVLGKEVKHKERGDMEGVVVEVEITQWPSATQNPRGRVIDIIRYEDDFGVDVEIIIRKHHIPHTFSAEVLEEAQEISPVIPQREIARRRDYRDLPIVTIDGETARDFDDAVLVRRLENGNYEL